MSRLRHMMMTATLFVAVAAHAVPSLTAPDAVILTNSTALVDITVSNAPVGDNITGVDLFLRYDSDVANVTNVITAGSATDGWNLAYNIVADVAAGGIDEIRISMASSSPLAVPASATLLQIEFSVVGSSSPLSTSLAFTLAELNEAAASFTDGSIAVGGSTATVSLPVNVAVGDAFTVTVVDADLVGQTGLTATVVNSNGDMETVNLTVGNPAGTFTGTISTQFAASGNSGNSLLDAQANDTVTASFNDPFDANGVATTVSTSSGALTITGGNTATLTLTPASVNPGDVITITVIDADLASAGPLSVAITNTGNTDSETVSLTEVATGKFEGTITTVHATSGTGGNSFLEVLAGHNIYAAFDDPYNAAGGPQTVSSSGVPTINGGVTAAISMSPASVDPGEVITVTVVDADLIGQLGLTATIQNSSNTDSESVSLTQGAPGVFTGIITTAFATASSGNTLLEVQANDAISASFVDPFDVTGGSQTVSSTPGSLVINGGTTATLALSPSSLSPGDDITVTVVDLDQVGLGTLTATITNSNGDTETVTLTEAVAPPAAAGTFIGAITTVFASGPSSGNGLLGIAPGNTITAQYLDPFNDAGGPETIVPASGNALTILAGTTGTLSVSAGVQAGGGLRIEVADADLNADALVAETTQVTVRNLAVAGEVETVTLIETGANTGVFRVTPSMPTSASNSPGDGTLQVGPLDNIEIEYLDALDNVGAPATVTANAFGTLWGDTSKNGTVRALDASLILQENVGSVTFDTYQTLVGDVSAPGVGSPALNGFDAVQILRFAVGLETNFPDVESGNPVHPYKRISSGRRLALTEPEAIDGSLRLSVLVSEAQDLLSGNLTLAFDPAQIRISGVMGTDLTQGFMIASRVEDGQVRIAFAGTQSDGLGAGNILNITFQPLSSEDLVSPLRIETASLNGGLSPAEVVDSPAALSLPQVFHLAQNFPNPFNPETQIRYTLPQDADVRLTIFDITGQSVVTLVDGQQTQGEFTVRWNARNSAGFAVASGLYFYRLEAGSVSLTRKMSLLR